jgi:hypothetical protein
LLDDAQSSEHLDAVQPDTRSTKSQRTPKPTVHADFVYNLPAPRIKSGAKRAHSESNNGTDAASDKKKRKSVKIEAVEAVEEPEMNGDCVKQEGKYFECYLVKVLDILEFQELHTVTNGEANQVCPGKSYFVCTYLFCFLESPAPLIKIIDCPKKTRTPKSARKPKSPTNGTTALQSNRADTLNGNDCHAALENGFKAEQTEVVNGVNDQVNQTLISQLTIILVSPGDSGT